MLFRAGSGRACPAPGLGAEVLVQCGPCAAVARGPRREKGEEGVPVLRVVSCAVMETFTSSWGKTEWARRSRIGCLWAGCGICLKPFSEASL